MYIRMNKAELDRLDDAFEILAYVRSVAEKCSSSGEAMHIGLSINEHMLNEKKWAHEAAGLSERRPPMRWQARYGGLTGDGDTPQAAARALRKAVFSMLLESSAERIAKCRQTIKQLEEIQPLIVR